MLKPRTYIDSLLDAAFFLGGLYFTFSFVFRWETVNPSRILCFTVYLTRSAIIECLAAFPSLFPTPPQFRSSGRFGKHTLWIINDFAWLSYCTYLFLILPTLVDRIILALWILPLYLNPYLYSQTGFIADSQLLSVDGAVALRDQCVTARYHYMGDLSYHHPLYNFVRNTRIYLADEHPLLRLFVAASEDTPGPHGLAKETRDTANHIIDSRVYVHFVSPEPVDPSLDPLGPGYGFIQVNTRYLWPTPMYIDEQLARNCEDEKNEKSTLPGYRGYVYTVDFVLISPCTEY